MKEVLDRFDVFLAKNEYPFEGIIIGGSALSVMGIISRHTIDVDFLSPKIPQRLRELASEFATAFPEYGLNPREWINNGPEALISDLKTGWESRVQVIFEGRNLRLWTLGRTDLLFSKIWAYLDRGSDMDDCIRMNPTLAELDEVSKLLINKDANPNWPEHVESMILDLKRCLGYE